MIESEKKEDHETIHMCCATKSMMNDNECCVRSFFIKRKTPEQEHEEEAAFKNSPMYSLISNHAGQVYVY